MHGGTLGMLIGTYAGTIEQRKARILESIEEIGNGQETLLPLAITEYYWERLQYHEMVKESPVIYERSEQYKFNEQEPDFTRTAIFQSHVHYLRQRGATEQDILHFHGLLSRSAVQKGIIGIPVIIVGTPEDIRALEIIYKVIDKEDKSEISLGSTIFGSSQNDISYIVLNPENETNTLQHELQHGLFLFLRMFLEEKGIAKFGRSMKAFAHMMFVDEVLSSLYGEGLQNLGEYDFNRTYRIPQAQSRDLNERIRTIRADYLNLNGDHAKADFRAKLVYQLIHELIQLNPAQRSPDAPRRS